ncbi:MAG: DNA methylase [Microcoleus sp. SU_5_6]|nr:DNA methylase [Microcoleus sp. SU_5_6]
MTIAVESQQTSYFTIAGDIPLDIAEGTLISVTRNQPLKIYSLGFQPAKSIPEIPRWFLQKYLKSSSNILEPFAGSGTSIIEALKHQIEVDWLDYHPLSRLICSVKTTYFSAAEVLEQAEKIIESSAFYKQAPETVNFANKDFWFQKPVQEGLEILKELILASSLTTQPVLWLAFASTVRKTSNMNDGMLLATKRSHIKEIPQFSREDVFNYFKFYAEKAADAISEWYNLVGDLRINARKLPWQNSLDITGDCLYDAIVTSPPYINAIDYVWATKFELHWLNMVESDRDRLNLYANEIGTERIPKVECKELGKTNLKYLDRLIEDIYTGKKYQASKGQNQLRSRVAYKYFMDMKKHFIRSFECLRSGGYYCFTIGDTSRICGVDIPVASLLAEIACEVGFRKQFHFHLLLKNRKLNLPRNVDWAGTIKHDTIIVLEKAV